MPEGTKLAEPPADPVVRTLRAKAAAHTRHGNQAEADAARRALDLHQLAAHIKRVVDAAPPLTDAQLGRLSVLLRPATEVARC